jgi:hypothetical protein
MEYIHLLSFMCDLSGFIVEPDVKFRLHADQSAALFYYTSEISSVTRIVCVPMRFALRWRIIAYN